MPSYEKINYFFRPSKQVERRLIIEGLLRLNTGHYNIPEYTYIGLGSVYFVDFILFHKYLFIDKMICSEKDYIPKRMEFNKPFKFIDLYMEPIGSIVPIMKRDKPYLVWLDYDSTLNEDELIDIRSFIHALPQKSILLITIPADNRALRSLISPIEIKKLKETEIKIRIIEKLNDLLAKYINRRITSNDLQAHNIPKLYYDCLINYINSNVEKRLETNFFQLFNFTYKDGMKMFTIGGIIDGKEMLSEIERTEIYDLKFISKSSEQIEITIPPLTIREKMWMEKNIIPKSDSKKIPFELPEGFIKNFKKYHRYYPTYYESLF